jgi:hypothetical protein
MADAKLRMGVRRATPPRPYVIGGCPVLLSREVWGADRPAVRPVPDHLDRPHPLVSGYPQVRSVRAEPDSDRPGNALEALTPGTPYPHCGY